MKLCKDCRWYGGSQQCAHPDSYNGYKSLVHGKAESFCSIERDPYYQHPPHKCGKAGDLWEPLPPKPRRWYQWWRT